MTNKTFKFTADQVASDIRDMLNAEKVANESATTVEELTARLKETKDAQKKAGRVFKSKAKDIAKAYDERGKPRAPTNQATPEQKEIRELFRQGYIAFRMEQGAKDVSATAERQAWGRYIGKADSVARHSGKGDNKVVKGRKKIEPRAGGVKPGAAAQADAAAGDADKSVGTPSKGQGQANESRDAIKQALALNKELAALKMSKAARDKVNAQRQFLEAALGIPSH